MCQYLTTQAKVLTVDTGLLGVGTSILPLVVAPAAVQSALYASFSAAQLIGIMAPRLIVGLANGLASGWSSLALLQSQHPGVGVGSGVARIVAGPAALSMIAGFASAGMIGDGPVKVARAIAQALDTTFAGFVTPVVIVGSPSLVSGAGVGLGLVV